MSAFTNLWLQAALMVTVSSLLAADSWDIADPLGRDLDPQWVRISPSTSASLSGLIGPDGPVAYQMDGDALWLITTPLPAGQTLTYQTAPTATEATPLRIQRSQDQVEIDTGGGIAARFPLGGGDGAPPPVLGVRLGNGPWSPASAWVNPKPIESWSSELLAGGPVFAKVRTTYRYADQTFCSLTATMIAGDSAVRWRMAASGSFPETKLELKLPAMPGVSQVTLPKGYGQWARADKQARVTTAPGGFLQLCPNTSLLSLFPDRPSHIVFPGGGEGGVEIQSLAPGDWVTPGPAQTYYGQTQWTLPMIEAMWAGWRARGMPVVYGEGGAITLVADCARGVREWTVSAGPPKVGLELQAAREMKLAWEESAAHPLLFLDAAEIQRARKTQSRSQLGDQWAALALKDQPRAIKQLREQLAKLGNFDVMRQGIATAALYDALIDSPELSATDRQLFRAQMAYLAYLLADPTCWSSERGYGSGNPNMHVSYILTLGVAACALRDHPMETAWAGYAADWLDHWLDHEVGPGGEWIPEGAHYSNVSLEAIVSFAIAAQRAGHRDFSGDPRLQKLLLFFAKMQTPPNPEHGGFRATPNYGRGTAGEQLATLGAAARFYAKSNPELSAQLQWAWAQAGYPTKIGDHRLGGLIGYYVDRDLPQTAPQWDSERFPELGAVLRAGFNTAQESYVNFLAGVGSERNLDVWTPSVTDIAQWFARGKPLSSCFVLLTGTRERHTLLSEGPQLARNYQPGNSGLPFGYYSTTDFSAFAALPGFDYARTTRVNTRPDDRNWLPPNLPAYPKLQAAKSLNLTAIRQVALVNGDLPGAPAFLVIRDTTRGGEPTAWQFWSLTKGLTAAGQSAEAGEEVLTARELPPGDRYSAQGQYGVDLEYFVAAPAKTPRHTLRYGGTVQHEKRTQFQDLLHLQLPGDGAYFVALYPRLPNEAAPQFDADRSERVIRVDTPDGAQTYVFLSDETASASLDEARFSGTAGSARRSGDDVSLVLGAAGSAALGQWSIKADFAASVRVQGGRLYIQAPVDCPGGELELSAPGAWSRVKARVGPGTFSDTLRVTLPAGESELIYQPK